MRIYYTGYLTTNLINQKKYIGVHRTTNPNDTYLGSGTALIRAIKKYGKMHFKKDVIAYMLNEEVMFEWEAENITQEIIDDPMYYTCKTGGKGGCKASIETRDKMSISHKNISAETRIKMSESQKNRLPMSSATRAKLSVAGKSRKQSVAARAKISAAQKGKIVSAETRAKISAAGKGKTSGMQGKTHSTKTRIKISASKLGKKHSTETRNKISAALKGKHHKS